VIDEWVNRSGIAIDLMGHFDFGDALDLDYSAVSLRALAAAMTEHFADPAEVLNADQQPLVEGVVAYLGECLLRSAGATGTGTTHPGSPIGAGPHWRVPTWSPGWTGTGGDSTTSRQPVCQWCSRTRR
jgi:hypothetical protein